MRSSGGALLFAVVVSGAATSAMPDSQLGVYFTSMRAPRVKRNPQVTIVYTDPSDMAARPIAGCDGNTASEAGLSTCASYGGQGRVQVSR